MDKSAQEYIPPKRCYFFSRNICKNGDKCPYFHDPNYDQKEKRKRRKEAIRLRKKAEQQKIQMEKHMKLMEKSLRGHCIYFKYAHCYKGDNCLFLHHDTQEMISIPQLVPEKVLPSIV